MRYYAPDYLLPIGGALLLLLLAQALGFNGLYGQDAYEYLRQCTALRDYWQGQPMPPATMGDRAFSSGFPVLGAALSLLGIEPVTALRLVNAVAIGASLWFFMGCVRLLTPGAHARSRYTWAIVLLIAPVVVRSGTTLMSDAVGLAAVLASLRYGLSAMEHPHWRSLFLTGLAAGVAVSARWVEGLILLPLGIFIGVKMTRHRAFLPLLSAALGVGVGLGLLWLGKKPLDLVFSLPPQSYQWSFVHIFQRQFTSADGHISYWLPNWMYVFSPLVHPACFAPLLLLIPLWRRTDLHLTAKKIILAGIVLYLLGLAGLPSRSTRFLLPAYAWTLLLWFPAWDRCVSYGAYFVPQILRWVLIGAVSFQLGCIAWEMKPLIEHNRWERHIAEQVKTNVPPDAAIYGMQIDISLRHYLPHLIWHNTWTYRYDSIPSGSYFLINEPLYNSQWEGRNPQINFQSVAHRLDTVTQLQRGWWLGRVR
jgi:hypothetical protein